MKKLNILLIDDNKTVLLITESLLKKSGYVKYDDQVETIESIESLTNQQLLDISSYYDIIICDHNLEERITGLDFLVTLKKYKFVGLSILLTSDESYDLKAKLERETIHHVIKTVEEGEKSTNSILGDLINKYRENTL